MFSQLGTTGEVIAVAIMLGVHILGGVALVYVLVHDSGGSFKDWWPNDGDDDGGSPKGPEPPDPRGSGGGLPLPGADPSSVRLREPGTIADGYPRPSRRPAHPERQPGRVPASRD